MPNTLLFHCAYCDTVEPSLLQRRANTLDASHLQVVEGDTRVFCDNCGYSEIVSLSTRSLPAWVSDDNKIFDPPTWTGEHYETKAEQREKAEEESRREVAKYFMHQALKVSLTNLTDHNKSVKYAGIMTEMENLFRISQIGSNEHVPAEIKHIYKRISSMRTFE